LNATVYPIPSRVEEAQLKPLPDGPMGLPNRFFAAFCEDLFDMGVKGTKGTPRADAVIALDRELRKRGERK
jgi:hypothetical protein